MNKLRALWWRISGSLWFVPSLMVLTAVGAAIVLIEVHGVVGSDLANEWPRLFGASAQGSREMLSAIASSMITVAGVVFSVTLVALSLAASQYSPRVLRTFMNDRPTQVVLGAFVSVFAYCLIVLRTIRGEEDSFVPSLAVLGGIALAFIAIGFLVFFIHHLATAIQVSTIISRVADGTLRTIEDVFPGRSGSMPDDALHPVEDGGAIREWIPVISTVSGYIVSVDHDQLADYASARGRILRMDRAIGDFVVCGQSIASLSGPEPADDSDIDELNALYSTDTERTLEQDPAFGIQQIVDIALKALSPGINDETTAIMCIDRLTEIFVRLARRKVGPRWHVRGGRPALLTASPDFSELAKLCVNSILPCAGGKRRVLLRLVWLMERIVAVAGDPRHTAIVKKHLENILEIAERTIAPYERDEIEMAARRILNSPGG